MHLPAGFPLHSVQEIRLAKLKACGNVHDTFIRRSSKMAVKFPPGRETGMFSPPRPLTTFSQQESKKRSGPIARKPRQHSPAPVNSDMKKVYCLEACLLKQTPQNE